MSTVNEPVTKAAVASLSGDHEEQGYGKSLMQDSVERLMRNRMAMIGLIVIILFILMAIFADVLAPRHFAEQVLEDNNAAPEWVISLFPILDAQDSVWDASRIEGGEILVSTGDKVSNGQLLVDFNALTVEAPTDGIIFANDFRIDFFPTGVEIPTFTIPAGATTVEAGTPVREGDTLFGNETSPVQGLVYINGDTLWVLPRLTWRSDQGEIVVEHGQQVNAGDPILVTSDGTAMTAPLSGTMQVSRAGANLIVIPVERFAIPEGTELLVNPGRNGVLVEAGDPLYGDVTAPYEGTAVLIEDELLIYPEQDWQLEQGISRVQNGQIVSAGDPLIDYSPLNIHAHQSGTVLISDAGIRLTPLTVTAYPLPENPNLAVPNGQEVRIGDRLYVDETAPERGFLYYTEDTAYFAPYNTGYVRVRSEYPMGADLLGRDILSRIIYGARVSLAVAFIGPLVATILGVTIGLVSGYIGGWVDSLIMRIVDIFYAFPTLLLIILMMAFFRSGAFTKPEMEGTLGYFMFKADESMGGMLFIFIGIGITSWIGLARLTRGQVLSAREQDYILAARALGASSMQIMWKHVLPNIAGPLIVSETLSIPSYIRSEAFLSFIGLGVNPPTPSWGEMISRGAQSLATYPFQSIFPAVALFIIMFAFNFLGDGLRDAFDPRLRGVD